ncbi:MAG: hypothetical protein ACXADC_12080 [Candidatus Thorarchaeota archaeon]|jgi:predicted transcriptional regulator
MLRKHRNTIKKRVTELFRRELLDRPVFPFIRLLKEYPLLVVARADLPLNDKIRRWIKEDENIFAAFKIREEEYNTMLFEFHTSLLGQYMWRESLVKKGVIPSRDTRFPSNAMFFSNELLMKYQPNIGLRLVEQEVRKKGRFVMDGFELEELDVGILKLLLEGHGIKVNENYLAREVGINRRTVQGRIAKMLEEGIILRPLCRFPRFFVSPGFIFVFSLVEVKKHKQDVMNQWMSDPHLSLIYKTSTGRYNFALFSNYLNVDDHLRWEEIYADMYPDCFGVVSANYLTPRMTVSVDQQKVSLGILNKKLEDLDKS